MDPLHRELIQQAVDAARTGDRDKAFTLLEQVLAEDEENISAWLLMARLSNVRDEKRMALTTVLQLDPNNQRAKQMLARLESETDKASPDVIPGVSRQLFRIIVASVISFLVLMLIGIVIIVNNSNQADAERNQERTRVALEGTRIILGSTETLAAETLGALHATQTQFAIASPTPTATATSSVPTLPPTLTKTPNPSPTPSPVPLDLPGTLLTWGGRDLDANGASPIQLRPLNGLGTYTTIPRTSGIQPFITSDGQRIIYAEYSLTNINFNVSSVDLRGNLAPPDNQTMQTLGNYIDSQYPTISTDGNRIAFIGQSLDTAFDEVFLMIQGEASPDNTEGGAATEGGTGTESDSSVRSADGLTAIRLTDDGATYIYPSLSPDGNQIVVVRTDTLGTDLVIIDVETRTLTPLTTNLAALEETMPRWSPNGDLIAFVGQAEGADSNDLYLISSSTPDSQSILEFASSDADEIIPVWSPDSQYLAFASNRANRKYNIYVANLQNQQVDQFTRDTASVFPGSWTN